MDSSLISGRYHHAAELFSYMQFQLLKELLLWGTNLKLLRKERTGGQGYEPASYCYQSSDLPATSYTTDPDTVGQWSV